MIPKIVHYCWFGQTELPPLAQECVASWHEHMPDWTYMRWDENNFDIAAAPLYVQQAYEAKKYAFVSDYVRLWALEQYGGLYLDVDFKVYRPFDDLMNDYAAFAGREGSKHQPVMMGVIASEPHGAWVQTLLATYTTRPFVKPDGSYNLTPNTTFFAQRHTPELHVFPVYYFCPVLTTGEDVRTPETYCEHLGTSSWDTSSSWKSRLLALVSPEWRIKIIQLKRKIIS